MWWKMSKYWISFHVVPFSPEPRSLIFDQLSSLVIHFCPYRLVDLLKPLGCYFLLGFLAPCHSLIDKYFKKKCGSEDHIHLCALLSLQNIALKSWCLGESLISSNIFVCSVTYFFFFLSRIGLFWIGKLFWQGALSQLKVTFFISSTFECCFPEINLSYLTLFFMIWSMT